MFFTLVGVVLCVVVSVRGNEKQEIDSVGPADEKKSPSEFTPFFLFIHGIFSV